VGLRLKPAFPAPLIALTAGVSAVAILATIFAFRGSTPPPNRCTDPLARTVALHRFPAGHGAHVTGMLHYATRAQSVSVHADGTPTCSPSALTCDGGDWRVDGVDRSIAMRGGPVLLALLIALSLSLALLGALYAMTR
jgi:hypothetical protein